MAHSGYDLRHTLMPLSPGTRLGVYDVLSRIGAGGMGEVYRARDTKLGRDVAIKVVLDAFVADPERLNRFEREARSLAALNHPHIATLHGMEESAGRHFLVMELVDGATLAEVIAASAIPLETALALAIQIADALDAAHEKGIVHRDLKPANIKVTADDKVKVLDFGLAKATAGDEAAAGSQGWSPANSPTFTATATMAGVILGTAAYMSPEQARGMAADHRSDIFSFGVVLYEMLTRRQPFQGDTISDVLASVLARDPDLSALPAGVAPRLIDLVKRCLEKHPKRRWQAIGDVRHELERIAAQPRAAADGVPPADPSMVHRARRRERAWMVAAAASLAALAVVSYRWYPRPSAAPEPITFTIEPPPGEQLAIGPGLLSVSPDGRHLGFVTGTSAGRLWIRDLDSLVSRPVPRITTAWQPAWSPDSRSIAISETGGRAPLRTVDITTGLATTVAPEINGRAAWSQRGVILYSDGTRLLRVPEAGGTPPAVAMDLDASRQELGLSWPLFLPDGRHYIFLARSSDSSKNGLFLAALDSPGRTFLVSAFSSVEYAGGYLFYVRDNAVVAHAFDADAGRLTGEAFPVLEDVQYNALNGRATMSVSSSGVLAYRKGGRLTAEGRRLMMFDRSGNAKQVGPAGPYFSVTISPDGRQAVVDEQAAGDTRRRLSLLDVERGLTSRFTVADVDERNPVWWPDGSSVVFTSARDGGFGLYRRSAAGGATGEERLFSAPVQLEATGVSPDGKVLLFTRGIASTARLWALPLTDERTPVEAIPGVAMAQVQATFSPDGKWIAYVASPGPGLGEVYIQPYPADDRRVRISPETGRYPFWTADGRHIVYRTTNDDMMSVELTPAGNTFRAGPAVKLFTSPRVSAGMWTYSMDARGEQFLMMAPAERAAPEIVQPLTVIVNWVASLKRP